MFNVRTLSLILAIIMVFGLASLAFAQTPTGTATATATRTATGTATATRAATAAATVRAATAAPTVLPTTGGTAAASTWMLPFLAFVVLFLVAGLGLNLARRAH